MHHKVEVPIPEMNGKALLKLLHFLQFLNGIPDNLWMPVHRYK